MVASVACAACVAGGAGACQATVVARALLDCAGVAMVPILLHLIFMAEPAIVLWCWHSVHVTQTDLLLAFLHLYSPPGLQGPCGCAAKWASTVQVSLPVLPWWCPDLLAMLLPYREQVCWPTLHPDLSPHKESIVAAML